MGQAFLSCGVLLHKDLNHFQQNCYAKLRNSAPVSNISISRGLSEWPLISCPFCWRTWHRCPPLQKYLFAFFSHYSYNSYLIEYTILPFRFLSKIDDSTDKHSLPKRLCCVCICSTRILSDKNAIFWMQPFFSCIEANSFNFFSIDRIHHRTNTIHAGAWYSGK